MWIKYTMMRIRIDQMLAFNWKFLTPVAFVLVMVTALMNALLRDAVNLALHHRHVPLEYHCRVGRAGDRALGEQKGTREGGRIKALLRRPITKMG